MKKVFALLLVSIMILSLIACGSVTDDGSGDTTASSVENEDSEESVEVENAESSESSLVAVVTSDPGSLSPYGVPSGGKTAVRNQLYEPLFWPDENGNLQPMVGKSYASLGDGIYEIEIFDYVYDSAGNHMTAEDVVFSYDQLKEEGSLISYITGLADYEVTGEYTLRFTFENEKIGDFSRTVSNCYLVTQAGWEGSGDNMVDNGIGTGLYEMASHVSGSEYVMTKRDDYWQTDESLLCQRQIAKVDTIDLKIISDTSTIAVSLENGEIDYTQNIVQADRSNFVSEDGTVTDGYVMKEADNYGFVRLIFNCGSDGIDDLALRQAICTAIDNAAICYNNEGNFGHVCEAPINPNLYDADESLNNNEDYYDYDEDAAKALVESSGYKGETIKMLVNPNERTANAAVLIQAYCKEIGIEIELLTYEMTQFYALEADTTGLEWDVEITGLNSNETYFPNVVTELNKNNYSTGLNGLFIDDAELQNLYDTAASPETNSAETTNDLVQYLYDNCYIYGMYYYNVYWFGRDCVKEVVVDNSAGLSMYNAFVVEK